LCLFLFILFFVNNLSANELSLLDLQTQVYQNEIPHINDSNFINRISSLLNDIKKNLIIKVNNFDDYQLLIILLIEGFDIDLENDNIQFNYNNSYLNNIYKIIQDNRKSKNYIEFEYKNNQIILDDFISFYKISNYSNNNINSSMHFDNLLLDYIDSILEKVLLTKLIIKSNISENNSKLYQYVKRYMIRFGIDDNFEQIIDILIQNNIFDDNSICFNFFNYIELFNQNIFFNRESNLVIKLLNKNKFVCAKSMLQSFDLLNLSYDQAITIFILNLLSSQIIDYNINYFKYLNLKDLNNLNLLQHKLLLIFKSTNHIE
jgi:hypothetical protein